MRAQCAHTGAGDIGGGTRKCRGMGAERKRDRKTAPVRAVVHLYIHSATLRLFPFLSSKPPVSPSAVYRTGGAQIGRRAYGSACKANRRYGNAWLHRTVHCSCGVCAHALSRHRSAIADENTVNGAQNSASAIGKWGVNGDEKSRADGPAENTALARALTILKNENKRLNELLIASEERCRGRNP